MRRRWERRPLATWAAVLVAVVGLAWVSVRLVVRGRPDAARSAVAAPGRASEGVREARQTGKPASAAPAAAAASGGGEAVSAQTDAARPATPDDSQTGAPATASSPSSDPRSDDASPGKATKLPTGGSTANGSVSPTAEEPVAGTTVTGHVLDRRTRLGVPGAAVVDATGLSASLYLSPAENVRGQLLSLLPKANTPVGGAPGLRGPLPSAFQHLQVVVTGPDGAFRLQSVPSGARQLVCVHRDHPATMRSVTLAAGEPARVDFSLAAGGVIEGTVRDLDGSPFADVYVQTTAPTRGLRTARTGADGAFTLHALAPGTYQLRVLMLPDRLKTALPWNARTVSVREGETTRVDFGGTRKGALLVGVIAIEGGFPKKEVFLQKAGKARAETRTELVRKGTFRFEGVDAGLYELRIPPTYRRSVTVPARQTQVRLDIRLPALTIAGVVRGLDSFPLKDVPVTAVRASDRDDPDWSMLRAEATTDAFGRFTLGPLDSVDYEVEVALPGRGVARRRVSLAGGSRAGLELRLQAAGTIQARVVDPNGRMVSNLEVVAIDAEGRKYVVARGRVPWTVPLAPPPVPAGTYTIWALSASYAFDRRTGVRFDGTDLTVEFGLSPGGTLTVRCIDSAGGPSMALRSICGLPMGRGFRTPS